MAGADTESTVAYASADATVIADGLHDIADAIRELAQIFAEPDGEIADAGTVPVEHLGSVT